MKNRRTILVSLALAVCAGSLFARVPADPISLEARHLLNCQVRDAAYGEAAVGAINDALPVDGPAWIVPRENGTAILGLAEAYAATGNGDFKAGALLAAEYLKRRQEPDGSWCEYYDEKNGTVVTRNKSVSQAGSAIMAFFRIHQRGWEDGTHRYYESAKKAAAYLIDGIDRKPGTANGLTGAGKEYGPYPLQDDRGTYRWSSWSWVSDNCYSYIALMCMKEWAAAQGDRALSEEYGRRAEGMLKGINTYLKNPNTPVWYRVVGGNGELVPESEKIDALCYYPQKYDLPVPQRGDPEIARWMADNLQVQQGTVSGGYGAYRWGSAFGPDSERRSHGFSLEACLALLDIPGQASEQSRRLAKAWWEADDNTGGNGQLWDTRNGGIVDWYGPYDTPVVAPYWQKFIDTSSNSIFVSRGGFNHLLRDAAPSGTAGPTAAADPGGGGEPSAFSGGGGTGSASRALTVSPNPYRPGSAEQGIVFDGLAPGAEIKIFTMSGELVTELREDTGSGRAVWNVRTESGREAASGAYAYTVTAPGGEKRTGKLAVLR